MHNRALTHVIPLLAVLVLLFAGCSTPGQKPSVGPAPSGTQSTPVPKSTPLPPATPIPAPAKRVDMSSPVATLKSAFAALEANDMNTYIDLLDPAIRAQPNNPALIGTILSSLTGVKLDTGTLAFRNMEYQVYQETGPWAAVRVMGAVRILSLGSEQAMDDVMVLHNIDKRWFISSEATYNSSPEAQAAATATAVAEVHAQETRVAELQEMQIAEARQAVEAEDWYVAATLLQSVLEDAPENIRARELLDSIADKVPGALVIGSLFRPFADTEWLVLPNWKGGDLIRIGADGKRAIVYVEDAYKILDIATGSLVDVGLVDKRGDIFCSQGVGDDFTKTRCWSRDLSRVLYTNKDWRRTLHDFNSGNDTSVCDPVGYIYWLDARTIGAISEIGLQTIDTDTGACGDIPVPGMSGDTLILFAPEGDRLVVLTAGKLFTMNRDGSDIRKIANLPLDRYRSGTLRMASDRSAVYVGGYVISTKTGRSAPVYYKDRTGEKRLSWLVDWIDNMPPGEATSSNLADRLKIEIRPEKGPIGTKFEVHVTGGIAGTQLLCHTFLPSQEEPMRGSLTLDADGSYVGPSERATYCGFQSKLDSATGVYTVRLLTPTTDGIYWGVPVAEATFEITD